MRTTARDADHAGSAELLRGADADLADVELVLAGEVNAFEGIVRRWQGPLVNMAWRYCRDRGRAEEMAQEALVRAWRGLKQWRREGSFSTWLFALAANVFRSELKRFPDGDVPIEDAPEPWRSSGAAERNGERAKLGDASGGLCWRCRCAIASRWCCSIFTRWMWVRLRSTMGMPEGTVKARLARARALLKKRFPHLEDEQASMELAEKEA